MFMWKDVRCIFAWKWLLLQGMVHELIQWQVFFKHYRGDQRITMMTSSEACFRRNLRSMPKIFSRNLIWRTQNQGHMKPLRQRHKSMSRRSGQDSPELAWRGANHSFDRFAACSVSSNLPLGAFCHAQTGNVNLHRAGRMCNDILQE